MDSRQKADLDRHITGNYGEDQGNARMISGNVNEETPVPSCTCNSPHLTVHASWCEQYQFWNF